MRNFFHRQGKFRPRSSGDLPPEQVIPEDLWVKCPGCQELIYSKELDRNQHVCPKCNHHFRLNARDRIATLTDPGSFVEWDGGLRPEDPLEFVDPKGPYIEKLARTQKKTGNPEALISGEALIDGRPVVLTSADFDFFGASMGSVWGEKMARAIEQGIERRMPVVTVNASGGARMHEGLFSLMQMAKTVAALNRLGLARIPHFSVLVDPCYGGVTASYATIADVVLAEPKALIGFAGQRVIEQVTKQKLPEGFQTAEFLLEHGMIDLIVERQSLRSTLATLIDHHHAAPTAPRAALNGAGSTADLGQTAPVADAVTAVRGEAGR